MAETIPSNLAAPPATGSDTVKRAALLIAVLASFLTPFMVSSINIAIPAISRDFHMSAVAMSWVATSYLLTTAIFLLPFGRLADIHGRKRMFTLGIGIYTLASLLLAFSPSTAVLIMLRAVQGFGSAMIFGTGMAIVISVYPASERGRVLGINVAAVYTGLSLGPFLGGFLTQQFGWRSIFLANVPVGLLVIYFVATRLKGEWAEAQGERFDLAGSVIYGLSLVSLMYGLSLLPAWLGGGLVLAGAIGIGTFARWERSAISPLLTMDLFLHNATFAFSNLAALINYSATFAVTFLLSLYLQYIKGFTPQHAGFILVAQPVVMAVFSPLAGRLSDKIEPRIVASLGMGLSAAGLFLFTFLSPATPVEVIVGGLMLIGFGFALFSSPNTNAVMSSIDRRFYGVGSATLGTMRLTGQMLSMGIATVIFALHIGSAPIAPENYPQFLAGVRTAFILFAALCFGGIFASLARGKVR
ncbi:MAG: MFS transporter [Nitrospirae bacterium GWC2_56_14]|nr:MAG: MFS transporter [Nitrospirae bacterium GWC2_56_14]